MDEFEFFVLLCTHLTVLCFCRFLYSAFWFLYCFFHHLREVTVLIVIVVVLLALLGLVEWCWFSALALPGVLGTLDLLDLISLDLLESCVSFVLKGLLSVLNLNYCDWDTRVLLLFLDSRIVFT
jgi:hypothetical protein